MAHTLHPCVPTVVLVLVVANGAGRGARAAGGEGEGAKKTTQLVGFLETQGLMGGRSGVDEKVETGERTASADRSTVDLI